MYSGCISLSDSRTYRGFLHGQYGILYGFVCGDFVDDCDWVTTVEISLDRVQCAIGRLVHGWRVLIPTVVSDWRGADRRVSAAAVDTCADDEVWVADEACFS